MKNGKEAEILKVEFDCPACKKLKATKNKIPLKRIIEKLDAFFDINDLKGAEALLEYWENEAKISLDLQGELSVVNEMLGLYRKTNNKEKAERAIKRALELLSLTKSENLVSGATIYINLATTCNAVGKPEEAVPFYQKAEEIYKEQELSKNDLRFAALYNNFATTLVDIKDFAQAEALFKKAITITQKVPEGLLDSAVSYVNMAHLYDSWQGSLCNDIYICLEKSEEILNNNSINKNSYYAFVCQKCAPSFDYFGFFAFANELNSRARKIYEGN